MPLANNPSILIIAGDPSGDHHAAPIIKRLAADFPGIDLWGIGGPSMAAEGFKPLYPFEQFNRMGFVEVAAHIGFFLKVKKEIIALMSTRRPSAVLCVDYPGFNMPVMKAAHALRIPVIWYIAPMVWAWKKKRAAVLGSLAAHIAVIFPFEVDYFKSYHAPVTFVGNPLVEAIDNEEVLSNALPKGDFNPQGRINLAIIPGSRRQEIVSMLPTLVSAFGALKQKYPNLTATISRCDSLPLDLYKQAIGTMDIEIFTGPLRNLLRKSDLAFVKSGTATLEAALMGVPMVIVFKTSSISFALYKYFVHLSHIGLPNIIAREEIVPECIQGEACAAQLASKMQQFLDKPDLYAQTRLKLTALKEKLGSRKPSEAVAGIIGSVLK